MAPHAEDGPPHEDITQTEAPPRPAMSANPPRVVIVGAGSRGNAYATAIGRSTNGILIGVVDPISYKRQHLGQNHIWGSSTPVEGQEFDDWKSFLEWEQERRVRAARGETVPEGVDAVFICVMDEMHREVIVGLAPLGIHIMSEKPLATTLDDCIDIYNSLLAKGSGTKPSKLFSIGHVLRYSPHNMLLRKLLLEDRVIGDIMSIEHTEPVGWWHFSHSYVRGNWRRESSTAPSLLTKSCHDIDLLLWLLCSPPPKSTKPAHLPTTVTSSGSLQYFNKTRKPVQAGEATNCFSCSYEKDCKYSAKKVYLGDRQDMKGLALPNTRWPVDIVLPEIEECISRGGQEAGIEALTKKLKEDYDTATPESVISSRNWFGRCVYEADNDVCDDQVVTMTWDNDSVTQDGENKIQALTGRGAKQAIFHMVAFTKKICERYSHIYGENGEIYANSEKIVVQDFDTGKSRTYYPHLAGGGHGGGDDGLARQFVLAVDAVKNHGVKVEEAQSLHIGCTLEEVIRSHAMVFAAEDSRKNKEVLDFPSWWEKEVESRLRVQLLNSDHE